MDCIFYIKGWICLDKVLEFVFIWLFIVSGGICLGKCKIMIIFMDGW